MNQISRSKYDIRIYIYIRVFILYCFFGIFYDPRDNCFNQMSKDSLVSKNGCHGLVGGTKETEYLQYNCVDCPYYKNNVIRKVDE